MPIVMPAVKLPRIKERTRKLDAGGRGAASEHATASASGGTAPCKLVIGGAETARTEPRKRPKGRRNRARRGPRRLQTPRVCRRHARLPDRQQPAQGGGVLPRPARDGKPTQVARADAAERPAATTPSGSGRPWRRSHFTTRGRRPASWRRPARASTTGRQIAGRRARRASSWPRWWARLTGSWPCAAGVRRTRRSAIRQVDSRHTCRPAERGPRRPSRRGTSPSKPVPDRNAGSRPNRSGLRGGMFTLSLSGPTQRVKKSPAQASYGPVV